MIGGLPEANDVIDDVLEWSGAANGMTSSVASLWDGLFGTSCKTRWRLRAGSKNLSPKEDEDAWSELLKNKTHLHNP